MSALGEFRNHPAAFEPRTWRAVCFNVVDGDTLDVRVDLGLNVYGVCRIRLEDYDAPETVRATSDDERARGQVAKALAEGLVLDQPVRVLTREKLTLGRYVGSVEYWRGDGWEDLATTLRSRGAEKLPGDKAWAGPKPQPRG